MTQPGQHGVATPPQPCHYRIRVEGVLGPAWSEWFDGMTLTQTEAGDTILSGPVVDQAALHGLLARIRDLNLTLVALEQVSTPRDQQLPQARGRLQVDDLIHEDR